MIDRLENVEELTNEELKTLIDNLTDEGALINVDAKNPSKPNKTELLTALNKYKKELAGDEEDEEDEEDLKKSSELDTPVKKIVKASELPRSQRKRLQIADKFRKECVLITDTNNMQTPDKAMFVSWGNGLIGHQTDVVNLEGRFPQYVRRGALDNLKNVMKRVPYQNDKSDEIKYRYEQRYLITPAAGLSAGELQKKKIEQQIKAANKI